MTKKLKIKNKKLKIQIKNLNIFTFFVCIFCFWFFIFGFASCVYSKEITILYTGSTHAMLYPCSCPIEPDGGAARRATLIKELRAKYPKSLLLDSGSFFAGGIMDEYTQDTQLDSQRSIVNLKAMELMKYDAISIGPDEFNFGRVFLEDAIIKTKIPFLSCNIKSDKLSPFIIKDVDGVKIGIIGVSAKVAKEKSGGLEFIEPKLAVAASVKELKNSGASIIVLLSVLPEGENLKLVNDVAGIDILIEGNAINSKVASKKISGTVILKPSWEGRSLDKLTITVIDTKIKDYKQESLRLSDKIRDDPQVEAILPQCFSDANCRKEGAIGKCQERGALKSSCKFSKANKINLLVISAKDCTTCDTEIVVKSLKRKFPGLVASYIYYPDTKAVRLAKNFAIFGLPAYILGKELAKEPDFDSFKENFVNKGGLFMLKPKSSGFSYFLGRENLKGKLDLFISLYDKNTPELLGAIKEFNPDIHFLATESEGIFDAPGGNLEVEEDERAVCVKKYYPEKFYEFISCRSKNTNTSWWEDCLVDQDADKVRGCAKSQEGIQLLKENISLNKELQVMMGPTYLVDNQEIFSSNGAPSKEELRKIIKR